MSHSDPLRPEQDLAGDPLTDVHDEPSQAAAVERIHQYEHAAARHADQWARVARPMVADLLRSALPMQASVKITLPTRAAPLESMRAADTELRRLLPLARQISRVLAVKVSRTIGPPQVRR